MPPTSDEGASRLDAILPSEPFACDHSEAVAMTVGEPVVTVSTTHPIGFWFFFWGELAERCSYYGMRAILGLYMVERLGFLEENSHSAMHTFMAACYLLPLVGGWVADRFLGKY